MAYELIPAAIEAGPRCGLTTPQAMVLVVLADAAGSKSRLTWLGQGEIGRLARLSDNATRAALRALEAAGLLSALGSKATQAMWQRRLPTVYLVHPDCAPAGLKLDRAAVINHVNRADRLGAGERQTVLAWLGTMGAIAAPEVPQILPAANEGSGEATLTRCASYPHEVRPSYPHEVKANQILLNQEENQDRYAPPQAAALDMVRELFASGVAILAGAGVQERQARSIMGRWRKTYSDGALIAVLARCQVERPSDPVAWLTKALQSEARQAKGMDHGPTEKFARPSTRSVGERVAMQLALANKG